MAIDSKTICQIAIIVEDLDTVAANYKRAFGIEPDIINIPGSDSVPAYTDGNQGDYSNVRLAVFKFDNMVIEIAEPDKNDSPWRRWLDKHGPGVQHIGFMVPENSKGEAFKTLKETGSELYHAGFYPKLTYTFVDCFKAFGIDFNIKWKTDNTEKIAHMAANPKETLKEV
jgi:hypothetical protein